MTTKKTASKTAKSDAAATQDPLYVAHQVHTLAQLMLQQISGSWKSGTPWPAPAIGAVQQPVPQAAPAVWPAAQPAWSAPAQVHGAPAAIVYWYA